MERTMIGDSFKKEGKIMLKGWVQDTRDLSKVRFLILRDITGKIQITGINKKTSDEVFHLMDSIPRESSVEIIGELKESKQAPGGKELLPEKIEIISEAASIPIDISDYSKTELPLRLDNRYLDTRRQKVSSIFIIRSSIYKNIVNYFKENQFIIINTPKITTIGLESGAESFTVNYFKKKASLAQSPQFYKQMFIMGGFERVMEIGQVYRAEKSHTQRHLTEFTGIDFEMGFIKDENDIMDMIEGMMKFIINNVKKECSRELEMVGIDLQTPKKIPRIPLQELKDILAKKGKKLKHNDDLDSEAEKLIGEYIKEKFQEEFVFVTNYPWKVRPFYHMKPENDRNGTKSFDLLWRGIEIATGAQREHRLDVLQEQAKEKNIKIDPIYEDIFKYGSIPHGGVGFGLDRIVQRMLNLDNIREALLLPRDPERLTP